MSKLLINEPPLQLLPTLAVKIGLQEAIVLQQIQYWLTTSKMTHEGEKWVYNTLEEWQVQFPFWSAEVIRKIFKSLRDQGVLKTKKLAKNTWDRTNYYSIDYGKLDELSNQSHAENPAASVNTHAENFTASVDSHAENIPHGTLQNFRMEKEILTASNVTDFPVLYKEQENTQETTQETTHESLFPAVAEKTPAPKKSKKVNDAELEIGRKAWEVYSFQFQKKYSVEFTRSPKANTQMKAFCKMIPADEINGVIEYFFNVPNSFYTSTVHDIGILLKDAVKLRVQMRTGMVINSHSTQYAKPEKFNPHDAIRQFNNQANVSSTNIFDLGGSDVIDSFAERLA
jgi:hypothetical protein